MSSWVNVLMLLLWIVGPLFFPPLLCVCCTCSCSYKCFTHRLCLGSCHYDVRFVLEIAQAPSTSCLCRPSWQPWSWRSAKRYGYLCTCRLQVNNRIAVKQKETFAPMISCAAFFGLFRFVANHVCMLSCCISGFGFWSQSNTTDMFCLHIPAPVKVALCSLWSSLYLCECTQWFPWCLQFSDHPKPCLLWTLAITLNIISLSQLSLSASPIVYLSANIYLWLMQRKQRDNNHKGRKVEKEMCEG